MKCLIFSDSHGVAQNRMRRVIDAHPDAEVVFFLGDGLAEAEALASEYVKKMFYLVRGNCDFSPLSPVEETEAVTLEGVRIVFTHGHKYDAKLSYHGLCALAAARGADICLFGHTHSPTEQYRSDGARPCTLFNPGSIGRPSLGRPTYGLLTVSDGQYLLSHGEAEF